MTLVKRLLSVTALLFATGLFMLYFLQEKLIFFSSRLPQDYEYPFTVPHEELFLAAPDGAVLNGLHYKQQHPKGVILYSHGNAGHLGEWGAWAQELSQRYTYDVVVWDYRGYGKSTGKRRQDAMLEDGRLFYDYCLQHFEEDQLTVFGRSLGTFFATHMALGNRPKQLILESGPTNLLDMAQKEYPWLPARLLLKFRFDNLINITEIQIPTHIIHGKEDQLVPHTHAEVLLEKSEASTKKLYSIMGGGHNNLPEYADYFGVLDSILFSTGSQG
ncbi:MAG: alpha/beta fold hydrolase [Bacteroidota bacterium]